MNSPEEKLPKNSKTVRIITDAGELKYGFYDAGDWMIYDCKERSKIFKDFKHELPSYMALDGEVVAWEEIAKKK